MLTDEQKNVLIAEARRAVVEQVRYGRRIPHAQDAVSTRTATAEASGVFVTLKARGELRGCLGTLDMRAPLADEVVRCAAQSASEDPRFTPVVEMELPEIALEVSVLGPLEPVDPAAEDAIVIGRHGLVVEQGERRGLLLPQVAVEWDWTREQFLRQTCVKAGLPGDAWRRGARVYRFDADVFGE